MCVASSHRGSAAAAAAAGEDEHLSNINNQRDSGALQVPEPLHSGWEWVSPTSVGPPSAAGAGWKHSGPGICLRPASTWVL